MKQFDALSMELMEGWLDSGLAFHLRGRFGLHGPADARQSPLRFVQLEEGERLDGAPLAQETMLLVLDGEVTIATGEERHVGDRGTVALLPPFVPYSVGNAGSRTAHLLALLPDAAIRSVFVAPLRPLAIRVVARDEAAAGALASQTGGVRRR